jgi:Tfp pilus assembly protein PilW
MSVKSFRHRGFTIIELLIYTGLVAVFLVGIMNMFLTTLDVQLESQASTSVDLDGRFIMARLNYDLHRASQITAPANIGDTSASLSFVVDGNTYIYNQAGQNLELSISGQSGILNSYGSVVPVFSVTRVGYADGIPSVLINLTLQSTTVLQDHTPQSRSYQTAVTLR